MRSLPYLSCTSRIFLIFFIYKGADGTAGMGTPTSKIPKLFVHIPRKKYVINISREDLGRKQLSN